MNLDSQKGKRRPQQVSEVVHELGTLIQPSLYLLAQRKTAPLRRHHDVRVIPGSCAALHYQAPSCSNSVLLLKGNRFGRLVFVQSSVNPSGALDRKLCWWRVMCSCSRSGRGGSKPCRRCAWWAPWSCSTPPAAPSPSSLLG